MTIIQFINMKCVRKEHATCQMTSCLKAPSSHQPSAAVRHIHLICYINPVFCWCLCVYASFPLSGWFTFQDQCARDPLEYPLRWKKEFESQFPSVACEGLTSTVRSIKRKQIDSCCTNRGSPASYDVIQELNVNEFLIYLILHWGVAG